MFISVKGVVLSETPFGEYDKYVTVLTNRGKISVCGKGVKRLKSPNFVSTQLFAYSEMTLSEKNGRYYIRESALIESFFGMRKTIEGISLANYIAEVTSDISVEGEDSSELLSLVLNCFHLIAEGKKTVQQIKAVFELRAACVSGFKPNLVACTNCGKYDLSVYYFDADSGNFLCEDCFRKESDSFEAQLRRQNESESIYASSRLILVLSADVYMAMRYVTYSKPGRIFAFELRDGALENFSGVCEKYFLHQMGKAYRTLDFYKSITK